MINEILIKCGLRLSRIRPSGPHKVSPSCLRRDQWVDRVGLGPVGRTNEAHGGVMLTQKLTSAPMIMQGYSRAFRVRMCNFSLHLTETRDISRRNKNKTKKKRKELLRLMRGNSLNLWSVAIASLDMGALVLQTNEKLKWLESRGRPGPGRMGYRVNSPLCGSWGQCPA